MPIQLATHSIIKSKLSSSTLIYSTLPNDCFENQILQREYSAECCIIGISSYIKIMPKEKLGISSIRDLIFWCKHKPTDIMIVNQILVEKRPSENISLNSYLKKMIWIFKHDWNHRNIDTWRNILCGLDPKFFLLPYFGIFRGLKRETFLEYISILYNENFIQLEYKNGLIISCTN